MQKSRIYLLPVPLSGASLSSLSSEAIEISRTLDFFVVENAKSARAFLKSLPHPLPLPDIQVLTIDRSKPLEHWEEIKAKLAQGQSMGILSEAGLPAIADPGHQIIFKAHQESIPVTPVPGPNSMITALMASGFSGQAFHFHGYLPSKKDALRPALLHIVAELKKTHTTQLFMEAPYRNKQILDMILSHVPGDIYLCVAAGLNSPAEKIKTASIAQWKTTSMESYYDLPAIFLLAKSGQENS